MTTQGKYTHFEDNQPNAIVETWSFDHDGTLHGEYHHDTSRVTFQVMADNESFHYQLFRFGIQTFSGTYALDDQYLVVQREISQTKLEDKIPNTDNIILDMPFISTKGITLAKLAQRPNAPTFAPLLTLSDRAGDLAKRTATFISTETITVVGHEWQAKRYVYGGYDYWVNDDNMVLRAESTAHNYRIELTEYKRL